MTDVAAWVRSVPDVASRLHGDPPARVAWIGCDDPAVLVRLAHQYPKVSVYASSQDGELLEGVAQSVRAGKVADRVVARRADWVSGRLAGWIDVALVTQRLPDEAAWLELGPALLALLRDSGAGFVRTSGYQPPVEPPAAGVVGAAPLPHLRTPEPLPETVDHALWVIRRG